MHETGFLDRELTVEGERYRYQVFVPREYRRGAAWPVVLALHGGGEYGTDGYKQTLYALANAIRQTPERYPAIVVFPQAHADGQPGWQGRNARAAMQMLDRAVAEFGGDRARLYLTGLSAGGNGSWYIASHFPNRFAAMVVICSFISEFDGKATPVHYPALMPASVGDPYAAMAKQVAYMPIWIFHGGADDVVSPDESRRMHAALKAISADVQYAEFPGVNHNAWDPTYQRADVIAWMFRQHK